MRVCVNVRDHSSLGEPGLGARIRRGDGEMHDLGDFQGLSARHLEAPLVPRSRIGQFTVSL